MIAKRVVDLVSNTASHLTERHHFARLNQFGLLAF